MDTNRMAALMTAGIVVLSALPGMADRTAGYRDPGDGTRPGAPFADLRIDVRRSETGEWWSTITFRQADGRRFGIRMLSERPVMESPAGPGRLTRYLAAMPDGSAFEYRSGDGAEPVLPALWPGGDLVPRPEPDAAYVDGFATTGRVLGQPLIRDTAAERIAPVAFDDPVELRLRADLLMGTGRFFRDDGNPPETPDGDWKYRPYARDELEELIAAGMNYFDPDESAREWMLAQPVLVRGAAAWPWDLYRSNTWPTRMFLDEPMVRMGWEGDLPRRPRGPEEVSLSLRRRVETAVLPGRIDAPVRGTPDLGTMSLRTFAPPTWETEYWAAFHEAAAGANGVVHEGRYRDRGYGWDPEQLFGDDLSGLGADEMFDTIYAFLRGPARVFATDWGMSVYGQSDPALRERAVTRAYDQGARFIWFWTSDHEHHMAYDEQVRLCRVVTEHAVAHPRISPLDRQAFARCAIVVPRGHGVSWSGVWGTERDATNAVGTAYGDIAAAVYAEAVLASRRGETFDVVVDHPAVAEAGYDRLIRVGEDAVVVVDPPWDPSRLPVSLEIAAGGLIAIGTPDVPEPDAVFPAPDGVVIDGDLSDWPGDGWLQLDSREHRFAENVDVDIRMPLPGTTGEVRGLGYRLSGLTDELRARYLLEAELREGLPVVVELERGSVADRAGLREGDVITRVNGDRVKWEFEVAQRLIRMIGNGREQVRLDLRRNGSDAVAGETEPSVRWRVACDTISLWFAAEVVDDVHSQPGTGWDFWKGDSIQIGIDPLLERRPNGYGENGHEIGFVLASAGPVAWRWTGRRGQPLGRIAAAETAIVRDRDRTRYEVRVPLSELAPLMPTLRPRWGVNIVVNDNDGGAERRSRLEWRDRAMTYGKHPVEFAVVETPVHPAESATATVGWIVRSTCDATIPWRVRIEAAAPRPCEVAASVASMGRVDAAAAMTTATAWGTLAATPGGAAWDVAIRADAPPGRYRLAIEVRDDAGRTLCADDLPVFRFTR